jgi:hypothetical protein
VANDVASLLGQSQPELDALFAGGTTGPIPDGPCDGTAIVAPGSKVSGPLASFLRTFAWQGKVFDASACVLTNRLSAFGLRAVAAKVYEGESLFDGKPCIVIDYAETSLLARWIRDEIRLIQPGMYLGKVYWQKHWLFDFVLEF